jgi:hypothetical protein
MSMHETRPEPADTERRPRWNRRFTAGLAGAALVLTVPAVATAASSSGDRDGASAEPRSPVRTKATAPAEPLPAPPQLRALDFMVGSFKCLDTPSTGETPFYDYIVTRREVGGHFYSSTMWTPKVIRSQRTWAWDPVNQKIVSQYRDDWGVIATSTAPAPGPDGKVVSSGPVTLVISPSATGQADGIDATVTEETRPVGKGRFSDVQSTTFANGFVVTHTLDCRKR